MNSLPYQYGYGDLLGYSAIALVSFITLFIALRNSDIFKIILVALTVRIFFILVGHYIINLPDSAGDSLGFEREAWLIGQDGLFNVFTLSTLPTLGMYNEPLAAFISWTIAIPYSLFGRSLLMAQSMSLLMGIGCVFLGWKLASILWDKHAAKKVAWTIALFPSLILYSVLVLREVYVCYFLLVGVYGAVKWLKTDNIKWIILAIPGFLGATLFHGSMIIGLIIFITFIGISSLKKTYKSLINYRINIKILIFLSLTIIFAGSYLSNKIDVPYLGDFEQSTDVDYLMLKTNVSTRGDASWPEWTKINSSIEVFYKSPIRSMYFVFAPFPWNVNKLSHLVGMFDAFLYIYLTYLIFCNIKYIWRDPSLRFILIMLLSYIFVFGFGVGNFGTGIRHRSKFAIMFILLAAPLIKRFIFLKKRDKV